MIEAENLAIIFAGIFFLNGLLTGVWKFNQISKSADGKAHPYVDIAHRSSLLYSFATLLIANFAYLSKLPNEIELIATIALVAYFAFAILSYMIQGFRQTTDNQLREVTKTTRIFMWSLIVAEIGGFLVLSSTARGSILLSSLVCHQRNSFSIFASQDNPRNLKICKCPKAL